MTSNDRCSLQDVTRLRLDKTFMRKIEGALKKRLLQHMRGGKDLNEIKALWEIYLQIFDLKLQEAYLDNALTSQKESDNDD